MPILTRGEAISISPGKIHSVAQLDVTEDVPAEARRTIKDGIRASVERENVRLSEEAAAFQEFGDQYRSELRDLMGEDGYSEYRALVREEKRRRGKLLVPRGKLELSAPERQGLRRAQQKRITAFFRARGISAKQLAALDVRIEKRFSKLAGPTPKRRADGPIRPSKVPKDVLASVGNPVTDPTPPYKNLGFWSVSSFSGDEGDEFTITGFDFGFNKATGSAGNVAQVAVQDASNSDTVVQTRRTLFGFWLQLPANTNSLKIWVHADLWHGKFFQNLTTEFYGTSHGFFRHENSLFGEVIGVHDGQSYQARTRRRWWTKGVPQPLDPVKLTGTWDSGMMTESGWFILEFNSLPTLVPVGNGQGLFYWVGTESRAMMWVDDEDGLGNASFAWRLNSIQPKS